MNNHLLFVSIRYDLFIYLFNVLYWQREKGIEVLNKQKKERKYILPLHRDARVSKQYLVFP